MNNKVFDLAIVGVGPAALTASIYASRYKLSNLVIGKNVGGELSLAHKVENYPGFESISGLELTGKMKEQAEKLGATVLLKEVGKIEKMSDEPAQKLFSSNRVRNNADIDTKSERRNAVNVKKDNFRGVYPSDLANVGFKVFIDEKEYYLAKAVVVATGSERRRLNVPGEKEYVGRGVSYCTTCDATFFRGKTVVLVGGSDSAVSGAVHTAEFASKVYIVYRGQELRAEPVWLDEWEKICGNGKGEVIYNTNISEILGEQKVTGVKLDKIYKGKDIISTDGVFIEIGGVPGTTLVQALGVNLDQTGHVVTTDNMETNVPGLFVAGDMIDKSKIMQQAITAMAQGGIAASSVYKYLKKEIAPQIRGI